jgi:UPF0755 protein
MTRLRKHTAALSLAKYSLFVLLAALLIGGISLYSLSTPPSRSDTVADFEVPRGSSVKFIASSLKDAGLIRSPLYFRLLVRLQGLSLQAGTYQLSPSSTPLDIAKALTKGLAATRKLVIPEGYRAEQIAEAASLPIKDFLNAASGLEGQLFPDTYFIKMDITAPELVALLNDNFKKRVGPVDADDLILASLVERETKGEAEKPIVAGILKKRLGSGWPLELDATMQYILGKPGDWWPNTTLLDRKIPSPYNTYIHQGLPPAPIGNPGLSSIRAVQNPQDSLYWFYLHDKTGKIHYGATLEEHNQNIENYLR